MTLAFTVYGVAQAKGNHRAVLLRGMKFPVITDSNRNCKGWQQLIAEGANRAIHACEAWRMLDGAVRLTIAFYLPRPKKYHRRGVNPAHLKAPDVDKLVRAVGDALQQVVYRDDSQVVELVAGKFYAGVGEAPRVDIRVESTAGIVPLTVPAAPCRSSRRPRERERIADG